jgi:chromosome segregation ATPase
VFIRCNDCGKVASSEVPDGTMLRAWVLCPECLTEGAKTDAPDTEVARLRRELEEAQATLTKWQAHGDEQDAEIRHLTGEIAGLMRELEEAREELRAEHDGARTARMVHGARDNETMLAFVDRIARERDALLAAARKVMTFRAARMPLEQVLVDLRATVAACEEKP